MRKKITIMAVMVLGCNLVGISSNNISINANTSNLSQEISTDTGSVLDGIASKSESIKQNIKEDEKRKKEEEEKKRVKKLKKEADSKLEELDKIKLSDKKKYIKEYKKLIKKYSEVLKAPKTIYDEVSAEEIAFLHKIVYTEIGAGDFDSKCNVASVILNRVESSDFPNTITKVLTAHKQFSSYLTGAYKKAKPDEEIELACEYVWLFGDTTNGAEYFRSGSDIGKFHSTLNKLFNDGYHTFYKRK